MTSNATAASHENNDESVVLRDLQSLLRKSIGKETIVIDYATTNLLPPGENYGSTILKVEAVIKRTKSSPQEKLSLVAKMIPTMEFQKKHFNAAGSFGKEIFVFEKLAPAYRQLEKEIGVKNEDLIDFVPKFYGGRLTMNEEVTDKADDDVVMLMENIQVNGYYTMDRRQGLDYSHAKLALTTLARFHALGMAIKQRKPSFFQEARKIMSVLPFDMDKSEFTDIIDQTLNLILEDERFRKYEERIRKVMNSDFDFAKVLSIEAEEPWVSIMHGDFWVNNIMFRKGEDGQVSDVKFIDFQLSKPASPLKDLPCFICSSINPDVTDEHFDDLLDIYHQKLIEVLNQAGCDVSYLTKEKFEEQLRKDANIELCRCLMSVKIITLDLSEEMDAKDIKASFMITKGSDKYKERCWKIVSKFVEKNWI